MATHVRHSFVMWLGGPAHSCAGRSGPTNAYNASTQAAQAGLLLQLCLCSLRREQPAGLVDTGLRAERYVHMNIHSSGSYLRASP